LLRDSDIINNTDTIQVIFNGIKNVLGHQTAQAAQAPQANGLGGDLLHEAERAGLCDMIEELQRHQNLEVYAQTQYIIRTYFPQQDQGSVLDKFYSYILTNESVD